MTRRGIAFVLVGVGGFVLQSTVLVALTAGGGWPIAPATAIAVECAIVANYLWHERWTWRDRPADAGGRARRLVRFHAANGLNSLVGSVTLTWLAAQYLGLPLLVANALSAAAVAAMNYRAADRWVFRATALAAAALLVPVPASADEPRSDTLRAWAAHVAAVEGSLEADAARAPANPEGHTIHVADGTISDWRGSLLVRNRSVTRVIDALVLSPELPRADEVIEARVVSRHGDGLHTYMKLRRRAVITVTYDTEHDVHYTRHSSSMATSRSVSTRIVESDGRDRGFLWRLHSYWRYRQIGSDVRIDLRSLTLSRSVPWLARPVAMPIVDRIGRESVRSTLEALARFLATPPPGAH